MRKRNREEAGVKGGGFRFSVFSYQILWCLVAVDVFFQWYFRGLGWGVMNRGVSFGLWPGLGQAIPIIVFLLFIILYLRDRDKTGGVSTGTFILVLGGLGNMLSRLIWGGIWDYLYLPVLPFWFNLSDVLITIGVIVYGWGKTDYNTSNGNTDLV